MGQRLTRVRCYGARMRPALVFACLLAAAACGRGSSQGAKEKPKGTTTDPVEVCERFGDICKLDSARLGVCSPPKAGTGLVCTPQH